MRHFPRSFFWIIFFSFPLFAMEPSAATRVLSLKELAARQVSRAYPEDIDQTKLSSLPQECRQEVARQWLLAKKYQELFPLDSQSTPLYLLKEAEVQEESFYTKDTLLKPTKHPNNPFTQSKTITKGFRCAFDFTQKRLELEQYENNYVDSSKNQSYLMRMLLTSTRLLAGPNKTGMFIYADGNLAYIGKPKTQLTSFEGISVQGRIYHPNQNDTEDLVTALEAPQNEDIFFGGTKSGKVFTYKWAYDGTLYMNDWRALELAIQFPNPIDDLHLSSSGEVLWILSGNYLHAYNRITHHRTARLNLNVLPTTALDVPEREQMNVFTLSPDGKYALIGGTRGTILIGNLETGKTYSLEEESDCAIYQLWWTDKNIPHPIVALKQDGMMLGWKLAIATAENTGIVGHETYFGKFCGLFSGVLRSMVSK